MGLFSTRPKGSRDGAGIQQFWGWWAAKGAVEVAAALSDEQPQRVAASLVAHVGEIHRALEWELAPGKTGSAHILVVSAAGDPSLRAVARRWLLAAPPEDATWAFSDVRLPLSEPADASLSFDGTTIDLAGCQVAAHVTGASVDVVLSHPGFAAMSQELRDNATFVLLDQVLGEAAVETWIGSVRSAVTAPLDPVPLLQLPAAVDALRNQYTDADGAPKWSVLTGTARDGRPLLAAAQVPLSATTAPQFDTHVVLAVPYPDGTGNGLPATDTAADLAALEDHLTGRLGDSGRVVARESHGGLRLVHIYADGSTPARDQLRSAVSGWPHGKVRVVASPDPGWREVAHLRS